MPASTCLCCLEFTVVQDGPNTVEIVVLDPDCPPLHPLEV